MRGKAYTQLMMLTVTGHLKPASCVSYLDHGGNRSELSFSGGRRFSFVSFDSSNQDQAGF